MCLAEYILGLLGWGIMRFVYKSVAIHFLVVAMSLCSTSAANAASTSSLDEDIGVLIKEIRGLRSDLKKVSNKNL